MFHSINNDQRLYVLTCGTGYSCLGFEVCENRIVKLCAELKQSKPAFEIGTREHYEYYEHLCDHVRTLHAKTGWRSQSELNPKLIGLEGKRIEAKVYGETLRFIVGKSTGFIPCHLEIKTKRSHGGVGLPSNPEEITNIRVIR